MRSIPRRTILAALAGVTVVVGAAALLVMMDRTELLAGSLDARITLPPGFTLSIYNDDVDNARAMARGDRGTIFVGTRGVGNLYALRDEDGDHVAERRWLIARNLDLPTGLAFRDGSLYVAAHQQILRWDGIEARLDDPPEPVVVRDDLPEERAHGWRYLRFGPDGLLYVPIGAPCNACDREDFAVITRLDPDGEGREIFARGVRNTVGFDFHPETGDLWFTDNGRDHLGDDLPPDELNHAPRAGMHFGFPYCHGGDLLDEKHGKDRDCAEFTAPVQKLGPHVAALGMRFYDGDMFPEEYRGRVFIAEHGSWNRSQRIGYRVTTVTLDGDRGVAYEPFATGWLQNEDVHGRPVDLLVMPDGSLLLSDDYAGVVYRIAYEGD